MSRIRFHVKKMNKFLVSWIAYQNDFKDGRFNLSGPTGAFHQEALTDYSRHFMLLSWAENDELNELRELQLKAYLKDQKLTNVVTLVHLPISDPTNHNEIRARLEQWLQAQQADGWEVFISPGTPQMQVVWYMLAVSGGFNLKLFQTRAKQFRAKDTPLREYINFEASPTVSALIIRQADNRQDDPPTNYLIDTPSLMPVYEKARRIAQTDRVTTLILGESGTGKENLAYFIHQESARQNKEFVAVNCSALSDELLESRLFGYRKGAFTGADRDQPGFFEAANGGTIFLDEIGDISSRMQQSLLRVLQQEEILRIGEHKPRKVDVRVIAATHRSLIEQCQKGAFRWDLYYRLAVAELELPSLFERGRDELAQLLDHFLQTKRKKFGRKKMLKLDANVRNYLLTYRYPGNVRELENLIERLYVFHDDNVTMADLPSRLLDGRETASWRMKDIEAQHLKQALHYFKGNIKQVAEAVGYSRTTLYERLREYGLTTEEKP